MFEPAEPEPAEHEVCDLCRASGPAQLGWSREVTAAGERWLCDTCTRDNVRAIEARLDRAWW